MELQEFVTYEANLIQEKIGNGVTVETEMVEKNNQVERVGLLIHNSANITPVIYLDGFYIEFLQGESIANIAMKIIDIYEQNCFTQDLDISLVMDYALVEKNIYPRIINLNDNCTRLEDIPHRQFLDLAIVYYIEIPSMKEGCGTILIKNSFLNVWEISEEALSLKSFENLHSQKPLTVQNLLEIVGEMVGNDLMDNDEESECDMFVITGETKIYGAVGICDVEFFDENFECDVYIIPSSIHELIAIPVKEQIDAVLLKEMVFEVNQTQVAAEEFLSNNIYYFSKIEKEISICE